MTLIQGFLKAIGLIALFSAFGQVFEFLKPPKPDSWQTLLWISAMSWGFSLISESPFIQSFIASLGWIFLIAGLHWAMYEKKINEQLKFNGFFVGPWITGALICVFLWSLLNDSLRIPISVPFIAWPPISAAIAAAPKFIKAGKDGPEAALPNAAGRQEVIILLLSNLVISCWFQLYFLTQNWLTQYPTFLAEDFSRSAFVVRPSAARQPQRGVMLLDNAESILRTQLAGASWPQVERWLLDLNQRLPAIRNAAIERMPPTEEDNMWALEARVVPGGNYRMELRSIWLGPTGDGIPFYLTKTCDFSKLASSRPIELQPSAAVNLITIPPTVGIRCSAPDGPLKLQS
jgi:hypothetical protein